MINGMLHQFTQFLLLLAKSKLKSWLMVQSKLHSLFIKIS
jgi:hypothetical protein